MIVLYDLSLVLVDGPVSGIVIPNVTTLGVVGVKEQQSTIH